MSRVVVSGVVEFPPEAREDALVKGKALIEGAYTEKGCLHYHWTADLNHPGRVIVFEEWDSGADLDAHLKGDWYRDMFAHLSQCTILSADIHKYRVTLKELVYGDDGIASGYFSDEK
jgi:quinol monooxygenase YgiN